MPSRLVELGSLNKFNFSVRMGILLFRPIHRAIVVSRQETLWFRA